MKEILYLVFCAVFHLCRIVPVKRNKVLMMCIHNEGENGALSQMESALNNYGEFHICWFHRDVLFASLKGKLKFILRVPYDMATANFIFFNDNFMPLSRLHFSKKASLIQLWHGEGAMKRSCLAMQLPPKEAKRLKKCNEKMTATVVSSKAVIPVYEETFGMPASKIYPIGAPRTDYFFSVKDKAAVREKLCSRYGLDPAKKIVLYAPTFRDDEAQNAHLMEHFPFAEFASLKDYQLIVRLHPQIGGVLGEEKGFKNVSDYESVSEIALAADMLISDYSSIIMDFTVQNKPMVFFAFDLKEFTEHGRGFYFDYESYVPGAVVKTGEELIALFRAGNFYEEKIPPFRDFNFDYLDKYNCMRVIEQLVK